MTILFHNANGDSGLSDPGSVEPVLAGDPVAPLVTNRPTHNLRLRTDVLRYHQQVTEIAVAAPVIICVEDSNHEPADLGWDGPFTPSVSDDLPEVNLDLPGNSGKFWFAAEQDRIVVYPANSLAAARRASVGIIHGSATLTFTTNAPAHVGNHLRVRIQGTLPSGPPIATWEGPDSNVVVQPVQSPVGVPAIPSTAYNTLSIQVCSNGSTTLAQLKTAVAAPTNAQGGGVTMTVSSPSADTTTMSATDTGYVRLSGGLDAARWYVTAATLGGFFNTPTLETTLTQVVTGTAETPTLQTVTVGSTTGLVVGDIIHVGTNTGGDYEAVTVQAVLAGPARITGHFRLSHANTTTIRFAPNRLQSGDTLAVVIGDAKARLNKNSQLSASDLKVLRNAPAVQQDTSIIPIASVPADSSRLIFANTVSIARGKKMLQLDVIKLAGDLAGPGSEYATPRVVRATTTQWGTVKVNAIADEGDPVFNTVAAVALDGKVLGHGLTSPTPATTLVIGDNVTNDAGVAIGRAGGVNTVQGVTTFNHGVKVPSLDATAAGNLPLGGVNTTSITLGADTTVTGDLDVARNIDVESGANPLALGGTRASAVELGRAGQPVTVIGNLKATGLEPATAVPLTIGAAAQSVVIGSGTVPTTISGVTMNPVTNVLGKNAGAFQLGTPTGNTNSVSIVVNGTAVATFTATDAMISGLQMDSGGLTLGTPTGNTGTVNIVVNGVEVAEFSADALVSTGKGVFNSLQVSPRVTDLASTVSGQMWLNSVTDCLKVNVGSVVHNLVGPLNWTAITEFGTGYMAHPVANYTPMVARDVHGIYHFRGIVAASFDPTTLLCRIPLALRQSATERPASLRVTCVGMALDTTHHTLGLFLDQTAGQEGWFSIHQSIGNGAYIYLDGVSF
jgi:hypothetical protein